MEKTKEKSAKNIRTAFFLNLFFSIIEIIGGVFTNSVSIISDAIHDFGDAISIATAWFLEKKSNQKPDYKYTYGYARFSVLGALITSIVLLVGSVVMLYNAIPRLMNPEAIKYDSMILIGILGVIINGAGALTTSKSERINEKAINLHLLEDVLGWIAVLVVSIVMRIFDLPILDPILSILITIYILYHVFKNLKSIFEIFLQKAPQDVKFDEFKNELLKENKEILDIHHIHFWTLDGETNFVTMHVLLKDDIKMDKVIELKQKIKHEGKHYNICNMTIEIEYEKEKCQSKECEVRKSNSNSHGHHHHH